VVTLILSYHSLAKKVITKARKPRITKIQPDSDWKIYTAINPRATQIAAKLRAMTLILNIGAYYIEKGKVCQIKSNRHDFTRY
jgi:hypothetical protein